MNMNKFRVCQMKTSMKCEMVGLELSGLNHIMKCTAFCYGKVRGCYKEETFEMKVWSIIYCGVCEKLLAKMAFGLCSPSILKGLLGFQQFSIKEWTR